MDDLHKCGKLDCYRLVSPASIFCCTSCALASEGGYEIHEHTPGCNKRAAERGEMTSRHLRPDHEDCECVEHLDHDLYDCDCSGYPLPAANPA